VSLLKPATDGRKESAAFALGTFVACGDFKSYEDELGDDIAYLNALLPIGCNTQNILQQ
jgi:hypothetical protein